VAGLKMVANRFARRSSLIVALLATVGFLVALYLLWWPGAGDTFADRANVSSAVATMFALFAAIVAITAAVWVTTSDYKAEQAVKADTAKIRAALRSIMMKGVWLHQKGPLQGAGRDFECERETLNKFLSSITAYGYWHWVEGRSASTPEGAKQPWSVFFLHLVALVDACGRNGSVRAAVEHAVKLEEALEKLHRGDIEEITGHVADLAGALGTATASKDPMLRGIREVYGTTPSDEAETRAKFRFLKRKGVVDPNVDMWVALYGQDTDALAAALARGADTGATDKQVLAAHEADLKDFDSTPFDE
jgi:hypothetical protein